METKKQITKKLLLLALIPVFMVCTSFQDPINGAAQAVTLNKILAVNIKELLESSKTLAEIRELSKSAIRTKQEIEKIYRLQEEIRKSLKSGANILNLKNTEIARQAENITGISLNPGDYIPYTDYTKEIIREYDKKHGGFRSTKGLYAMYHYPTGALSGLPRKKQNLSAPGENFLMRFGHEKMYSDKKLKAATLFKKMAEEYTTKALEIETLIKDQSSEIAMSDAERLALAAEAQRLLEKSIEFKLKYDELIIEIPTEAIGHYHQFMENYAFRDWLSSYQF